MIQCQKINEQNNKIVPLGERQGKLEVIGRLNFKIKHFSTVHHRKDPQESSVGRDIIFLIG